MQRLSEEPNLILPKHNTFNDVMWHLFPIRVPTQSRERVYSALKSEGILVQVNYLPAYRHPVFATYGFKQGDFPISDEFYAGEISLPMYFDLTLSQQNHVIDRLKYHLAMEPSN